MTRDKVQNLTNYLTLSAYPATIKVFPWAVPGISMNPHGTGAEGTFRGTNPVAKYGIRRIPIKKVMVSIRVFQARGGTVFHMPRGEQARRQRPKEKYHEQHGQS